MRVISTDFRTAPVGKGANQAVQCAHLSTDVTMAGCVGDDAFGREMLAAAGASGVDVSHVKRSTAHSSGIGYIQLEIRGSSVQNRILVVPGANYDLTLSALQWLEQDIQSFDMVMLQLELTMEVTKYVAACARSALLRLPRWTVNCFPV